MTVRRLPRLAVLGLALLLAATGCSEAERAPDDVVPAEDPVTMAVRTAELLGSAAMYDREQRGSLLEGVAHPEATPEVALLQEGYDRVGDLLGLDRRGRPETGSTVARTAVLGAELVEQADEEATVELWTVGLLGVAAAGSAHPVQQTWSTETVELRRTTGGWRFAGLTSEQGPVPVGGGQLPSLQQALLDLPDAWRSTS